MDDTERALLSRYGLTSAYPESWPKEKDEEDAETVNLQRMSTMASTKSTAPTLLSRNDEPDPLGSSSSVVDMLRYRGGPVDDTSYRSRFLTSSTSFSPSMFLSEVHKDASTEQLMQGLQHLSLSIEQKSASLKLLVESNFERFVRAKATIDNVYTEMRNHGSDDGPASYGSPRPAQTLRSNGHIRTFSRSTNTDQRKNALTKESEFGTQGIRTPLVEATVKAEEVWGPALGGHEREEMLKAVLTSFEKNKRVMEAKPAIEDCIKRHDYEALSAEYTRAQGYANDARDMASRVDADRGQLSEAQVYQIILTARMWADVQERMAAFKQEAWARLMSTASSKRLSKQQGKADDRVELVSLLLQIGVDENPSTAWLSARKDYLHGKITNSFERSRVELEIYRRRLANGKRASDTQLASCLCTTVSLHTAEADSVHLDRIQVIQFWHHLQNSLDLLLSTSDGILGEVVEYYETAQSFIDDSRQKGASDRSSHHLTEETILEIQKSILDLCAFIQSQVHTLFTQPPVEDVSALLSATSPVSQTPQSANILAKEMAVPITKTGADWETYAFWPPHSSCRSAAYFLADVLTQVCNGAAEMASLTTVRQSSSLMQMLRGSVSDIRDRTITAITSAWLDDSEHCGELEDWVRPIDSSDITNMPANFRTFEESMLRDLQKIVYLSEIASTPASRDISQPPTRGQIETIQQAFRASLFKVFGCVMEHTTKSTGNNSLPNQSGKSTSISRGSPIDASDLNARKLLTMANCQYLRTETIPILLTQFEITFSLHTPDDAKEAQDSLAAMHARIFQSYVKPVTERLRSLIASGISSPSYGAGTARPTDARPYVYQVLLELVLVHAETMQTTPAAVGSVLSYHLEQLSQALIDAFKQRARYSLPALMQATLDVEFLAQTLNNYTTERASDVQGQIYLALDERTDNEARQRLQNELPEMRAILKRLREKTRGEFACFKKIRVAKDRTSKGERS